MRSSVIDLTLDGDGAWPELKDRAERGGILHVSEIRMAARSRAIASGKPSVTFRLDLEDGTVIMAESSLAALLTAMDAIVARHGDPR